MTDEQRHRLEKTNAIKFIELIGSVIDGALDEFPQFDQQTLKQYLAGEIPHVSFNAKQISPELLIQALNHAANVKDERTYAQHAAEHVVFPDVVEVLIRLLNEDRKSLELIPSQNTSGSRLILTTKEPLEVFQNNSIFAQFGKELEKRDEEVGSIKNRGKELRRVAKEHGITFAILAAFYAGLDVSNIIDCFSSLADEGIDVPTQNRNFVQNDKNNNDHSFLVHIQNILTNHGKWSKPTFQVDLQQQAVQEINRHPSWGNQSHPVALLTGYFPAHYSPLVVFEGLSNIALRVAGQKGINLENPALAAEIDKRVAGIWTTQVVTAYRKFEDTVSYILSPNQAKDLTRYIQQRKKDLGQE